MSDQDKAEGFEECRRQVQLLLARVPIARAFDVAALGNPFAGARNALEPQVGAQYPSYCKVTGCVFPCGCASCDAVKDDA